MNEPKNHISFSRDTYQIMSDRLQKRDICRYCSKIMRFARQTIKKLGHATFFLIYKAFLIANGTKNRGTYLKITVLPHSKFIF